MSLRINTVTFAGHAERIKVAGTSYGLPPGSKTVQRSRGLVYVLTPDNEVHALVGRGEVVGIPKPLGDLLRARIFGVTP